MEALRDQVVLITGCSTGIGRALALEVARRGHHVFATARRPETLDGLNASTAGDPSGAAGRIETLALDVNDEASIAAAVAAIDQRAGRIDILINNAGLNAVAPLAEAPIDDVRRLFETNVLGLLAVTRAVFPHMAARRKGRIVNLGSVVGILPTPFGGPYCASKAAVHMLSEVLRIEAAPFGVDVVVVQPGGVRSAIADNAARRLERYADRFALYRPVMAAIEARATASQDKPMDTAEFAQRTCDELLRVKAPRVIRHGRGATWLPRLAALPGALRDQALSRRFGLNHL